MRLPLTLAALVLIIAGAAGFASGITRSPSRAGPTDGHRHGRVPRAALIALVPLAVLTVLHPPALDDAATQRVAPAAAQPQTSSDIQVEPLSGNPDTPKAMSFNELSTRANASNGPQTLRGRTLLLEGFVSKNQQGAPAGTLRVGRYMIWCCAADATFGEAFIRWPAGTAPPTAGQWFRIAGRVQDIPTVGDIAVPVVDGQHVQPEHPPKNQYEY